MGDDPLCRVRRQLWLEHHGRPKEINTHYAKGPTPIKKPAAAHTHAEARSITGGVVYHGDRLPELAGAYIYGDHVTGRIWSLRKVGDKFDGPHEISRSPLQIICFGTHNNGEMYIVGYEGTIGKLVPGEQGSENQEFPVQLSESGLFNSVEQHALADGVLPYSVIAEPWMDGATADRFLGVPGTGKLEVYTKAEVMRTGTAKIQARGSSPRIASWAKRSR